MLDATFGLLEIKRTSITRLKLELTLLVRDPLMT